MNTIQEKFEDWFIYTNRPADDLWKQLDQFGDYWRYKKEYENFASE